MSAVSSLTAAKRTSQFGAVRSASDPQPTSASISFCGGEAGFSPINVLVIADTMLLPDHEGAHEAARSSWCYWWSSSVAARGVGAAAQERTSNWLPGDGLN